jgi:glycosyltransferase involved in cell wall biosynthesis
MKILHVIPAFAPAYVYGGPINSVYSLCKALAAQGCEVRTITTDANGSRNTVAVEKTRDVDLPDGFQVRYCRRTAGDSISYDMLRLLREYIQWADIVHLTAVYSFPTLPTLVLCRWYDKPVVWSPRGSLQSWRGIRRSLFKRIWDYLCLLAVPAKTDIHFTSEMEARSSEGRLPGIRHRAVIPNVVEVPESVEHRGGDGRLRLVYLGRLHPKKGIENLIDACNRLKHAGQSSWSLRIAGSGENGYVQKILDKIAGLGLANEIVLTGSVIGEAKERLFQTADIVVVPSYSENFCMVVGEALAHGVPVIASQGSPWPRLEKIGCGLWVNNDAVSLADAIERMRQMPLDKMGQLGREWMRRDYSPSAIARSTTEMYARLLGASVDGIAVAAGQPGSAMN